MWDLIVSVSDHCLSFYFEGKELVAFCLFVFFFFFLYFVTLTVYVIICFLSFWCHWKAMIYD